MNIIFNGIAVIQIIIEKLIGGVNATNKDVINLNTYESEFSRKSMLLRMFLYFIFMYSLKEQVL